MLLHPFGLASLPLLHDLAPRIRKTHPELWAKLLERQSPDMRAVLEAHLADPSWQRGAREKLWGEIGWIVGSDGKAMPDPQGREFITATTPLPTHNREPDTKANGAARPATEAKQAAVA
jgi:hypothetical protein